MESWKYLDELTGKQTFLYIMLAGELLVLSSLVCACLIHESSVGSCEGASLCSIQPPHTPAAYRYLSYGSDLD